MGINRVNGNHDAYNNDADADPNAITIANPDPLLKLTPK